MQQISAIIGLTWKAAFRYRLFWVLMALLLLAVAGLPVLIKDDGTAEGFAQILITYTLGAVTGLLGLCTLWLACGTLARDVEDCQIQMVAVKPIARWQIWLGKWLGIVLLNAALLACAGLSIYGLLEWRARRLPANELSKLQNEVLVARASVKEQNMDKFIEQTTDRAFQAKMEKHQLTDVDLVSIRRQIREQVKAEIQVVPPGAIRPWVIHLGDAKDQLKNQPLYLRVKFNTAQVGGQSATFYAAWQIGTPKKTAIWQDTMSLSSDTFHEFRIDPNLFDDKGDLVILFRNVNDTALLFPLEDGMEVLYRAGGFGFNFIRGLAIILCWMSLLAALGLAAASFLSFPVAAFFSLAVLTITLSSGTLTNVVSDGTIMGYNEEKGTKGHSVVDTVMVPTFRGILDVINLVQGFSPIDSLTTGRLISWKEMGLAVSQIVLLMGGFIALCGMFIFSRRELATAQGRNNAMPPKIYKGLLTALVVVLLVVVSFVQRGLVGEREALGLTKYTELKGAPPVLALTTVALGGFRGLISNALWIRASDLQDQDKYFEMVQLADWITKLEPHFTQVWLVQAWNMAYNISVKFKDPEDRWRWVQRGIELLRDQGLRYNPDDILMYRELAWFFQHKMGQNLDDAHMYYKQMWANEMFKVFGFEKPNWDELIHPTTEDAKKRAALLRDKYKMDPVFMKEVDERYGPLEWRLPETHAIYWAALGLRAAKQNPDRVDPNDLITLRRVIYQSMQLAFQRGRLIMDRADKQFEFGPNLANIPNANKVYLEAMDEDAKNRDHIQTAHRNFLRDAVFLLYTYNRQADAINWFKYLSTNYPNKPLLDGHPNSLPKNMDLDDFAIGRIQEELNDPGRDQVEGVIEGFERQAYESLALGDDDRYLGLDNLAQKTWAFYQNKIGSNSATTGRVGLRPMSQIKETVLRRMLNGELSDRLTAQLRTRLNIPAPAPASTNAPPEIPSVGATNTAPAEPSADGK